MLTIGVRKGIRRDIIVNTVNRATIHMKFFKTFIIGSDTDTIPVNGPTISEGLGIKDTISPVGLDFLCCLEQFTVHVVIQAMF